MRSLTLASLALVALLAVAVQSGHLPWQWGAGVASAPVLLGLFGISLGGIVNTIGGALGFGSDDDKDNADAIRRAVEEIRTSAEEKALAAERELARIRAEQQAAENRRLQEQIAAQQRAAAEAAKQPPWLLIGGGLVAVYLLLQMKRK